jgi:hypothetical protein
MIKTIKKVDADTILIKDTPYDIRRNNSYTVYFLGIRIWKRTYDFKNTYQQGETSKTTVGFSKTEIK